MTVTIDVEHLGPTESYLFGSASVRIGTSHVSLDLSSGENQVFTFSSPNQQVSVVGSVTYGAGGTNGEDNYLPGEKDTSGGTSFSFDMGKQAQQKTESKTYSFQKKARLPIRGRVA